MDYGVKDVISMHIIDSYMTGYNRPYDDEVTSFSLVTITMR